MIYYELLTLTRIDLLWINNMYKGYGLLGLRSDIYCQYWKSIVHVMYTINFQYWEWISERSLDLINASKHSLIDQIWKIFSSDWSLKRFEAIVALNEPRP